MPSVRAQPVDDALDLLRPALVHGQYGILGDHHHGVLEPDHGGDDAVTADEAVARSFQQHVADSDIPVRILRQLLPQRVPAADIGPAEVGGYHRRPRGPLGYGVVEADVRACLEGGDIEADEIEI